MDACTKAWESGLGALRGPAPAAVRSHHAEVLFNHLVRRLHAEAGFPYPVGPPLVVGQLFSAVLQAEHPKPAVEPLAVDSVLPLHLAVVPRRRNPDSVVLDSHVHRRLLKQRPVPGLHHDQRIGKFHALIRLYHPDRERRMRDQFHQKILCAIAALLFMHLPVRASEARQGCRSGHYDRNLTTTSGDVTLPVIAFAVLA